MAQTIGYVTLVVREYDEAIAFFTQKLGFELVEDSAASDRLGREKRWVLVTPPHSHGTKVLLARASTAERESHRQSDRGPSIFVPSYRRFLARLSRDDCTWREILRGAAERDVRNGRGVRGSLRQQVGFAATAEFWRLKADG